MRARLFAAVIGLWIGVQGSSAAEPSPVASPPSRLRPFKERLAAAESVRVETNILGLTVDTSLEQAHERLDPLGKSSEAAAEGEEGENRVLWQLAKSDFAKVLVKTDDKKRVTYIAGFLRPGKEIAFEKIGQTKMAPMLTDDAVAWDVVRPDRPLIRVVARGEKRKAASITIFVVKRPPAK